MVYCAATGKKPSITEDDNEWMPNAPYPIEVMAGFKRLIDAFLGWSRPRGLAAFTPSLRRYVKLEKQRDFFVAACQAKGIDAPTALSDLISLAFPTMRPKDRRSVERMVAGAKVGE